MIIDNEGDSIECIKGINKDVTVIKIQEKHVHAAVFLTKQQVKELIQQLQFEIGE